MKFHWWLCFIAGLFFGLVLKNGTIANIWFAASVLIASREDF